jgi:hypothetical protein
MQIFAHQRPFDLLAFALSMGQVVAAEVSD